MKKRAEAEERNEGPIMKGFERPVRLRSTLASFHLGLLILKLVCLSSYSRRRKNK